MLWTEGLCWYRHKYEIGSKPTANMRCACLAHACTQLRAAMWSVCARGGVARSTRLCAESGKRDGSSGCGGGSSSSRLAVEKEERSGAMPRRFPLRECRTGRKRQTDTRRGQADMILCFPLNRRGPIYQGKHLISNSDLAITLKWSLESEGKTAFRGGILWHGCRKW